MFTPVMWGNGFSVRRATILAGVAVTLLVGTVMSWHLLGFPFEADGYSRGLELGVSPDVWHDRVTALESLNGDPYRRLSEMMPPHGYAGAEKVVPRTPAALLLQLPLVLIPTSLLAPVITTIILLGLVFVLWLTVRISHVEIDRIVWIGPVVALSFPIVTAVAYGSLSSLIMVLLVLMSWAYKDKSWAGVPLGLAMATRLWPGLIALGFWISGRRKAAIQSVGVFLAVNLIGLLLPGVGLSGSLRVIAAGGSDWIANTQNASLARFGAEIGVPIGLSVLVVSVLVLFAAVRNPKSAIPLCAVGGLIASPLSWPIYSLIALPAVVIWWRKGSPSVRGLIGLALLPALAWLQTPTALKGSLGLLGLLILFAVILRHPQTDETDDHDKSLQLNTSK